MQQFACDEGSNVFLDTGHPTETISRGTFPDTTICMFCCPILKLLTNTVNGDGRLEVQPVVLRALQNQRLDSRTYDVSSMLQALVPVVVTYNHTSIGILSISVGSSSAPVLSTEVTPNATTNQSNQQVYVISVQHVNCVAHSQLPVGYLLEILQHQIKINVARLAEA